jgi:hypothetical protein
MIYFCFAFSSSACRSLGAGILISRKSFLLSLLSQDFPHFV